MQFFDGSAGRDDAAYRTLIRAMDRCVAFLDNLPSDGYNGINDRIFPPTGPGPRDTLSVCRGVFDQLLRINDAQDQLMIEDVADVAQNVITPPSLHAGGVYVDIDPSTSSADYAPASPHESRHSSTIPD